MYKKMRSFRLSRSAVSCACRFICLTFHTAVGLAFTKSSQFAHKFCAARRYNNWLEGLNKSDAYSEKYYLRRSFSVKVYSARHSLVLRDFYLLRHGLHEDLVYVVTAGLKG